MWGVVGEALKANALIQSFRNIFCARSWAQRGLQLIHELPHTCSASGFLANAALAMAGLPLDLLSTPLYHRLILQAGSTGRERLPSQFMGGQETGVGEGSVPTSSLSRPRHCLREWGNTAQKFRKDNGLDGEWGEGGVDPFD